MEFKTEKDVTGATWIVAYESGRKNPREEWRYPVRRIHRISSWSGDAKRIVFVRPNTDYEFKHVDRDDVPKLMKALFPTTPDDGPYR